MFGHLSFSAKLKFKPESSFRDSTSLRSSKFPSLFQKFSETPALPPLSFLVDPFLCPFSPFPLRAAFPLCRGQEVFIPLEHTPLKPAPRSARTSWLIPVLRFSVLRDKHDVGFLHSFCDSGHVPLLQKTLSFFAFNRSMTTFPL